MATREELEAQESDCDDAASYAALAARALEDPTDPDYARELLTRGEQSCSFPADYLRVAEVAVALGDNDKAAALYEEAEGMCFDAKEKAEVGYSIGLHLGDKEKGRSLIDAAVADTKDPADLLLYAGYIKEALSDDALANKVYAKATGDCKSIDDYKKLASSIKEKGDTDTARLLYEKAAAATDGVEDIPAFAGGISELFDDREWVEKTLAGAEGDCMFPGQFVAIARAYQNLLENRDKAAELLEQGKEFAMSGQENLDLANGYAELLDDRETASGLYQQALNDFTTKDELLKLAADVAGFMEDKGLAVAAYDKVEQKLSSPGDFQLLAQAVNDVLGDKEKVAGIYARVEAKLEAPAELVSLAAEVSKNLADGEKTGAIYGKALENSRTYTDTVKLMDAFAGGGTHGELVNAVLGKALDLAEDAGQMLDVAHRGRKLLPDDNSQVLRALDRAEENTGSLDEMRKLFAAVKTHAADDEERLTRVSGKLEKREQSQARYMEFQKQEKTFTRAPQFIGLAYRVVEELDDASYAGQLLAAAQEQMKGESYNLNQYLPLIIAVERLAKDADWTRGLLEEAAENCSQFPQVKALGETVAREFSSGDFAGDWLRSFYQSRLGQLDGLDASAYEYLKMARAIRAHLADGEWSGRVLEAAAEHAADHFQLAHIAEQADQWGDGDRAQSLFSQAAETCTNARAYRELVMQMRRAGVPDEAQRQHYARGEAIEDQWDKLRWAEGIMDLFGDQEWSRQVYAGLEALFRDVGYTAVFENSRARSARDRRFW